MGGENPYIDKVTAPAPTRAYKMTFLPLNRTVEVDPEKLPDNHDGLLGSILTIAHHHGIDIDHACGGVCACATCHVVVTKGLETLNEATDDEEDQLENAPDLKAGSRLACQVVPDGSADVVVEIPGWNRNLVQEEH